ncbi:MAG: hypothetical protein AUG51_23135 [Acidobacteria bacterium 13_1_20CM_3_53_8]|nr:MAG: hypothetical protein AUG51_23135 [Acidobacteria bacterium 13_1_20CM_3_53_8]
MLNYEIIIAGAGPSGSAAAIRLANLDPELAQHVLLLDRDFFPRPKLCAGGVTNDAELILSLLGVGVELPSVPIHISKFVLPTGSLTCQQTGQFKVLRRVEFDHYLFQTARERGIVTQDGEAVENIKCTSDGVLVRTSKDEYRTKILIGADGANSTVRRFLKLPRRGRLMMALEILVPTSEVLIADLIDNMAIFDFSLAGRRIPGYFWIFPTVHLNPPALSMGMMVAPFRNYKFSSLKNAFTYWLQKQGLDLNRFELQAHPALRYQSRASYSQHRVLLVGDAAGIDPLFGEGVTSALALGTIAAQSAFDAIRKGDFSFSEYEKQIRYSSIGTLMRRRCLLARKLYERQTTERQNLQYETLFNWVAPINPQDASATITWKPL